MDLGSLLLFLFVWLGYSSLRFDLASTSPNHFTIMNRSPGHRTSYQPHHLLFGSYSFIVLSLPVLVSLLPLICLPLLRFFLCSRDGPGTSPPVIPIVIYPQP